MKTQTLKHSGLILCVVLAFLQAARGQTLSLQQSIDIAAKNNYLLKISSLETEGQQLLVKTARELPKTNIDVQLGRTQTPYTNDYTLGLVQQFAHPKLYQAQADLQQSHVVASQKNQILRKSEIVGSLKQLYYQLYYYQQLRQALTQQDSVYRSAMQMAQARYKAGESNALEKISAEVRLQDINNRLRILDKDESAAYQAFKIVLNSKDDFSLDFSLPLKRDTTVISRSFNSLSNPLLAVVEQQTEVSKMQTNLEKQRLKPDFRLGIINQSIEHQLNQMVVSGGIGIPIFTKAQKARIEAAQVNEKIAESHLRQAENQITGQLHVLRLNYEKHRSSLAYYEKYALPQANVLMKNAMRSYQSGEIDYVELVQNNQQAWQIKDDYLLTVLNFNHTIIQIETLLGID
ncbi:TolC family protein [Emticicia sp. 21SJ11W-3]|uniref:TolC family protein n=1 Tax=Emticicia sp. 21SJ11W-3 TaxID=2916755 RepID=UPI00209D7A55|nr:TolC family protein [Emticicia sp. 21SJ11W-3]UTA69247.1 TolC family protein [Emticicia sp. 21SJ11W-3]